LDANRMTILFIAPLPPPTNGQSLAADVLYRRLAAEHDVKVVNMAKPAARHLWDRLGRLGAVFGFLRAVAREQQGTDVVYLTISQSFLGNLKDLCIYFLCRRNLGKTTIHLLGGAAMKRILASRGLLFRMNRFFLSRVRAVVVEGRNQAESFRAVVGPEKIHIVHNFAEDFLFVDEADIRRKFETAGHLRVLFLSNLLYGKGHRELVAAYKSLEPGDRDQISIAFAGGFDSEKRKSEFLQKIDGWPGLTYLGFMDGEAKKALFLQSHVFCLPTYYPYEGQPISILEAYATGCVVVATKHSGIPEVFQDGLHGFEVEKESSDSIRRVLETVLRDRPGLVDVALANRNGAYAKYRTQAYQARMAGILLGSEDGRSLAHAAPSSETPAPQMPTA
jgi:glycosyltransferase involved in cell wall biosynthesis